MGRSRRRRSRSYVLISTTGFLVSKPALTHSHFYISKTALSSFPQQSSPSSEPSSSASKSKPRKNWDGITTSILASEKEKTSDEDPNVGGDTAVNGFFQQIFADADDDTKKAMMKSYQESGGTTLSTNWDEVKKGKVEVKPPSGSEWKKWN
jgi:suppressor of G2 allele of SKP1